MSPPSRGNPPGARPESRGNNPPTVERDLIDGKTAQSILGGDSQLLVERAEELGKRLARQQLQTSQIRAVFGTVRRIEMGWPRNGASDEIRRQKAHELRMIRPKLAYQAARHARNGAGPVRTLEQNLRPLIDGVGEDRERFQRLVDFFEATLAYHRAYGGAN